MYNKTLLEKTLKSHGYSLTKTRSKVFAALEHAEAQSLAEIANVLGDTVDRATVYRTIALFEQLGVAQRLNIGWKYKIELANEFQDHHHHLTCVRCDAIIPFREGKRLDEFLNDISQEHHFELHNHQLELRGICSSCRGKQLKIA